MTDQRGMEISSWTMKIKALMRLRMSLIGFMWREQGTTPVWVTSLGTNINSNDQQMRGRPLEERIWSRKMIQYLCKRSHNNTLPGYNHNPWLDFTTRECPLMKFYRGLMQAMRRYWQTSWDLLVMFWHSKLNSTRRYWRGIARKERRADEMSHEPIMRE